LLGTEADIGDVRICETAEQAVDVAPSMGANVVLMDVDLPGMNGIEAIAAMLQECPEANIVVITALQDARLIAKAIEAGASGFISKSRAADELLDVVRKAAAGEMVLPEGRATQILQQLQRIHRHGAPPPNAELTAREIEVLQAFADGLSSLQVASRLYISHRTVQSHVRSVLRKLDVHSKLHAVLWGLRQGCIQLTSDAPGNGADAGVGGEAVRKNA
jgi:DNA-binding NarL/FixJ family response regulator